MPYHNILVRMPNWMGDCIMATPVLRDLRAHFPQARLTALCKAPMHTLLENNPFLDALWPLREKRMAIREMRHGAFDLGVLLTNSLSSVWGMLSGKVAKRVGFRRGARSLLLTHPLSMPKAPEHLVTTYKRLLQPLGIPLSSSAPEIFLTEQERAWAKDFLPRSDLPVIGVHPVATYGPAKCWPAQRFRQVTEALLRRGPCTILYFGDAHAAHAIQNIVEGLPGCVHNLAGKTTLRQLASVMERCAVVLTNDSGPMHLADALHVPTVALFGSTCDVRTGPYRRQGRIINKRVACSPCFRRTCPIDFRCMHEITVDDVLEAVTSTLNIF